METTEIFERLLGTSQPLDFVFSFLYALLGATMTVAMDIWSRDVKSKHTPEGFSFRWFLRDNRGRLIVTPLFIYLAIRFYAPMNGAPLTDIAALFIGMGLDSFVEKLKSKAKQAAKDNS